MRSPYSTDMLYEEVPIQCCMTGYSSSSDSGFAKQSVTLVANVWSEALTAGRVTDLTNQNSTQLHSTLARALRVADLYNTTFDEHFPLRVQLPRRCIATRSL